MACPVSFCRHILEVRALEDVTISCRNHDIGPGPERTNRNPTSFVNHASLTRKACSGSTEFESRQHERAKRFGVSICTAGTAQAAAYTQEEVLFVSEGRRSRPVGLPEDLKSMNGKAARSFTLCVGLAHDMPRAYGYASRGERCHEQKNRNARGRMNVIGELLAGTLIAVGVTESSVNAP